MNKDLNRRISVVLLVLILTSLACSLEPQVSKGETQSFNEGGFSLKPPEGSSITDMGSIVLMEGKKVDMSGDNILGPYCTASAYDRKDFKLDKDAQWGIKSGHMQNTFGLTLSTPSELTIDGQFALEGELGGAFSAEQDANESEAYGKVLMVSVNETRLFELTCMGPASRKDETISMYESLSGSIQFFEPILPTPVTN